MTTATRSVAVVATRLPLIDRRALSQAWYSALHVTQAQTRGPAAKLGAAGPAGISPSTGAGSARRVTVAPAAAGATPAPRARLPQTAGRPELGERRVPAGVLARRIERRLLRYAAEPPVKTATVAVRSEAGRVQLLVRRDGATTRIIAVCAPELRERVEIALAHARFALAANGHSVVAAAR